MNWDALKDDEKKMWRSDVVTRAFVQAANVSLGVARMNVVSTAASMVTSMDAIRFNAGYQAGIEAMINLLENG